MQIVLVVFFCAMCLFAAGAALWNIFEEIRRAHRLRAWPAAMAQIVDSQVTGQDSEVDAFEIHLI